jgi:hypothetical protein
MINNQRGWISVLLLVTVLVLLSGISSAEEQRYTNPNLGISFPITQDMILYTSKDPGPFTFDESTQFFLVNKWKMSDLIMLNISAVTDEVELDYLKSQLEKEGIPKQGYVKVAVRYTTVGNPPKRAVEHIFDLRTKAPKTIRQISLINHGKGLAFYCTANADRFQDTNKEFFDPFLRSIKFE